MAGAGDKSFLRWFIILLLLFFAAVAGFNVLIDSYGIFGMPLVRGVNFEKHGQDRHPRIAKAYSVRSYRPDVVILGTSRAESTFDPEHPFFHGKRVYNLAFPGAAIYEQYRFLQHAAEISEIHQAIFTVDFFQFIGGVQQVSEEFNEDILSVDGNGQQNEYPWRNMLKLAATGSALKDSWWSFRRQNNQPSIYRANGYRNDSGDIPEMLLKPGGQHEEFIRSERLYVGNYGQTRNMLMNTKEIGHSAYDDMDRLLPWAKKRGIDLVVVIPPVHARHLELIYQLGRWHEFEEWKSKIVTKVALTFGDSACVWDFSGFSEITTEKIPQDSKIAMLWWRESSHASSATGREMLNRMQNNGKGGNNGFGRCLRMKNLTQAFDEDRRGRRIWLASNVVESREVELIAKGH